MSDIAGAEFREGGHAVLPVLQDGPDRRRVEARLANDDVVERIGGRMNQRYTGVGSQTDLRRGTPGSAARTRPDRASGCAAARPALAGPEQAEDARVVLGDHVDGAGARLGRRAAEECTAIAARM